MFRQFGYADKCLADLRFALESKRDSNDTNGKNLHLLCHFRHDRRSACTCTAAHTGCDKQHLCAIIQRLVNTVAVLSSQFACTFRLAASAQSRTKL